MKEFSQMVKHLYKFLQKEEGITIKLVVIGVPIVGKSPLVLNFVNYIENESKIEPEYYNTNITIDNKSYNIKILDTDGGEDYLNLYPLYANFGEGFLLVFSITNKESFENLNKRRHIILRHKREENVPMILLEIKQIYLIKEG